MGHNTYQKFNSTGYISSSNPTTIIQPPEQRHSSSIDHNLSMMNDNNIFPTPHTNNNYSNHTPNENIAQPYPTYPTITSSYAPQYGHPQQPIENLPSPLDGLNMTTINPSQSEIFSFDIPGFKIIIIPTSSQQDNTFSNYSSSSDVSNITDNQFTQFQQ